MKIVRKKASSPKKDSDLLNRARSAPLYDPKKSDSYLSIAKEYLRMYDDKGAESPLYEALKFNHSNWVAHYLLAEINFHRAHDLDDKLSKHCKREAERHLQTAAKLEPKNPEIWALYGFLLREIAFEDEYLRDSERIIEYLQRALKLGILDIDEPLLPDGGRKNQVLGKLAHTFKDTKKFVEALKIFQKLYKLHGSVGILREIAICYEKLNNHPKAIEFNLKVIKTKDAKHHPDAFFYVALFAHNTKRFDDALKYAEKLMELERVFDHPGYTDKTRNAVLLSQILESLNDIGRALIVVNTALLNAPQHSILLLQKSAFLADLGRFKEASEILDLLQEIEKKKSSRLIPPTVLAGLKATILLHSKDYRGAIRIASKVLKIQPDTIGALDVIGRAYLGLEQYDKSLKAFQKIQKLRPDEVPLLTLSSLYLGMGNVKNAISSLEKWLKQNPSLDVPNIVRSVDDKLTILLMGATMYHEVGNGNPSVKNLKRALDLCNKALKLSKSDKVLAYKIHILLHLKRFKDAYETFLKIKNTYSLPKELKEEHFLLHLDVAYCNQKLKNPPKDFKATTAFVKNFTKAMKNPNFKKYFSDYCFNKELHAIHSELTVRRGMK